jgi:hypothetical protein
MSGKSTELMRGGSLSPGSPELNLVVKVQKKPSRYSACLIVIPADPF